MWIYLYALFSTWKFQSCYVWGFSAEQTKLKNLSKYLNILSELIHTFTSGNNVRTMGNCCLLLPTSLSIFGILLLKLLLWLHLPHHRVSSQVSARDHWNMKLNDLTLFLVLTCTSVTKWEMPQPGLAFLPLHGSRSHHRSFKQNLGMYFSQDDFRSCSNLPGVS